MSHRPRNPLTLLSVSTILVAVKPIRADHGAAWFLDDAAGVALEWAVRQRETARAARVVAVAAAPGSCAPSLRQALAVGADEAFVIRRPSDGDVRLTSRLLAAAAQHLGASLVACGYESMDRASGLAPAAIAAHLGWSIMARLREAELRDTRIVGLRDVGVATQQLSAVLPAVLSFTGGWIVPRFPKMGDLLRNRNRKVTEWRPDMIGASDACPPAARLIRTLPVPTRRSTTRVLGLEDGVDALLALVGNTGTADG